MNVEARIFNHSRFAAALLALVAAAIAALLIAQLSDTGSGSLQPPAIAPAGSSGAPAATQVAPSVAVHQATSKRRVIIQTGRSAKGRSATAKGKPGESVKSSGGAGASAKGGSGGGSAKGGDGGSAHAEGGSATSGSVVIQTEP